MQRDFSSWSNSDFFGIKNLQFILNQSTKKLLKIIGNSHKAHPEGTLRWFLTSRNLNNSEEMEVINYVEKIEVLHYA